MAHLGTLATIPLELRYKILSLTLDIEVAINEDGSQGSISGRQYLPPAMEQDLEVMGGLPMESCTYVIRSPTAFHAFLNRLSPHNRRRVHNLRLVLLASVDKLLDTLAGPTFDALMDPGWRNVFKALPNTMSSIVFDMSFTARNRTTVENVTKHMTHRLSKFSTLTYFRTKGRCQFKVEGCKLLPSQENFESATVNVVKKPTEHLLTLQQVLHLEGLGVSGFTRPFW
ncbi:MAG: hypothetical protein M1835_006023 [Candelina submexicana]|nr:MAG: hypothetical protein M1835_006023 [Candelina submexicana]